MGKISDTVFRHLRVDSSTHSLQTIDYPHHEIHGGSAFTVHIQNTTANTDGHRTLLGFETPAGTTNGHLIVEVSASAAASALLYEGITIDDDAGTEIVIEDRNRVTDNTSIMQSFTNPVVVGSATWMLEAEIAAASFSSGTTLEHFILVAGSAPRALGGDSRGTQEWVLAPSTKYAVVIVNEGAPGAGGNSHRIHLDWYEHQVKD
jgi:hypothetical protein